MTVAESSVNSYAGDRLPTDDTEEHGNAGNDKLLLDTLEISKQSKLKTRGMDINNTNNIYCQQPVARKTTPCALRGRWISLRGGKFRLQNKKQV